jgi:hypothetical protein
MKSKMMLALLGLLLGSTRIRREPCGSYGTEPGVVFAVLLAGGGGFEF